MFDGREYFISSAKYLELDISFPYQAVAQEVCNLKDKFIKYRQSDSEDKWSSLPIIGKSSTEPYSWNNYDYKDAREAALDMTWTEVADCCPETVKWLEEQYPSDSYGRTRFMLLEKGGEIKPHKDTEHSVLGAINIPITNPKGCVWVWPDDNETLEMIPGKVYAMNLSHTHSVINPSQEDRFHLIIHHYDSTAEWRDLFTRSAEKNNVKGYFLYSQELF